MCAHLENVPFLQHVYHQAQTFNIWKQTNGKNAQIAKIFQLQKQLKVFNKIFLWKSLYLMFKMFAMHLDDIAKVCGKLFRICCSTSFSSRMDLSLSLV